MTDPQQFLVYQSKDGKFAEVPVFRFFRTTAADGKQNDVAHYKLDMVSAPGFFEQHCALFHCSNAIKQAAQAAHK